HSRHDVGRDARRPAFPDRADAEHRRRVDLRHGDELVRRAAPARAGQEVSDFEPLWEPGLRARILLSPSRVLSRTGRYPGYSQVAPVLCSRAISIDILHFTVRVLVIPEVRGYSRSAMLIEDMVLSIDSGRPVPVLPASFPDAAGLSRFRSPNSGQHTMVTPPRRLTGTSRTTSTGLLH